MGKKSTDIRFTHGVRVTLAMKKYKAENPLDVGLRYSQTVVSDTYGLPDMVKKMWLFHILPCKDLILYSD
jgi:hypothetical protein